MALDNCKQALLLDAFLFYNELDLLKARLEYLGNTVDYFVIAEANIDFAGRKKDFILNEALIQTLPFAEKIIYHREYIHLNSIPWLIKKLRYINRKNRLLWKIQDAQRNSLLKPLHRFKNADIVIFSDLDEFPSAYAISEGLRELGQTEGQKNLRSYSCNQIFFYYNIHNAGPEDHFYGSILTNLGTLQKLLPHKLRSQKDSLPHIQNGGWHFSYFMDEEKILNKINAISDVENLSQFKELSTEDIKNKIRSGADLYDRKTKLNSQAEQALPAEALMALQKYLPHCT
jgi:beta-1,4-mannosyl-glycoprotein beta-1,4-N-acetylglucosaminyltransferase